MGRPTASAGSAALRRDLATLFGAEAVPDHPPRRFRSDASEASGIGGEPDAVVLPASAAEVAELLAYCYQHGIALTPRGGGTGFAGGAVAVDGGVVVALDRLDRIRSFDPGLWRIEVESGVTTATVRRLARENGLYYPPDPGAAEGSQIGGNVATNAGGPHAFKYGVTGAWVTGLEAVVPPGELLSVGGPVRKDVAGYDLGSLLVGSEGTLGIVTAAWLRLIPAPEAALPIVAFYPDAERGATAIEATLATGTVPAAVEFLDEGALRAAAGSLPGGVPAGARFLVIAEADGDLEAARRDRAELAAALGEEAVAVREPDSRAEVEALWSWRDGVSVAVSAQRGGKLSEDIAVPVERLAEAIEGTVTIGADHGLEACSWGHAGDGNLHSTFLVDPASTHDLALAHEAAQDLFELAVRLGGSVSGEHGLGWLKRGQLARQWPEAALRLHEEIKRTFDPKGLLNPGKKLARRR